MKSVPSLEDRFQGCFLGLAIGDALGYPTEFLSLPQIQQRYGPTAFKTLSGNPALHSDDTQTSLAVARSLIQRWPGRRGELDGGARAGVSSLAAQS